MTGAALPRADVVGTPVSVATLAQMADRLFDAAATAPGGYVCVANVHMLVEARRDPELMTVVRGALEATSDGMPLVWELRRQGHDHAERVYGPELTLELCARMEEAGLPVAFYGGAPGTLEALRRRLRERFPGLPIAAAVSPPQLPSKPQLDPATAAGLAASGARIVFVGLGCPKQEFWMARHAGHVPAVLIGVGAAFDFLAGEKPWAPAWVRRAGLEWLYRLVTEPRRLWRRYLVTNTVFVWAWLRERIGAWRGSR